MIAQRQTDSSTSVMSESSWRPTDAHMIRAYHQQAIPTDDKEDDDDDRKDDDVADHNASHRDTQEHLGLRDHGSVSTPVAPHQRESHSPPLAAGPQEDLKEEMATTGLLPNAERPTNTPQSSPLLPRSDPIATPKGRGRSACPSLQISQPGSLGSKSSIPDTEVVVPGELDRNDLLELELLNEQTINKALQIRFKRGQIYTYVGNVLLCVNPFEHHDKYDVKHHELYADWRGLRPFDPHVYWTASLAQRGLFESQKNQVILVSGESGAGKTEVSKHVIEHLTFISNSASTHLANHLIAVNPLLEAFGNAETVMNCNSSRFGKLIEVCYMQDGTLLQASILDFLLEKSRVVTQCPRERNFHVFYYMFSGMSAERLQEFHLQSASDHRILQSGTRQQQQQQQTQPHSHDAAAFRKLEKIMRSLDFKDDDINTMYGTLAAILFLTDIAFTEDPEEFELTIEDQRPLRLVADLLKLDALTLTSALLCSFKQINGERITSFRTEAGAIDARDSLAKSLYARLFGWMVKWVNQCMQPLNQTENHEVKKIGILDMSGFEVLQNNSFEQLCINAANERLQCYFVQHLVEAEQQRFIDDGLDWQNIEIPDKDGTLDLLFHRTEGLLCILDEQSYFPEASDKSLMEQFVNYCGKHERFLSSKHHAKRDPRVFAVRHYACLVWYDTKNWLTKNRDRMSQNILDCLVDSENVFIRDLFSAKLNKRGSISTDNIRIRTHSLHGGVRAASSQQSDASRLEDGLHQLKRSVMRSNAPNEVRRGSSFNQRQVTLGRYFEVLLYGMTQRVYSIVAFKNSLTELMEVLIQADPHFIRCFRPNCKRKAQVFEEKQVMIQLNYTGIVQLAQVRAQGFAHHILISKFARRYKILLPAGLRPQSDWYQCEAILCATVKPTRLEVKTFAIGNTMVFMTEDAKQELDMASQEMAALVLQACTRSLLARRRLDVLKEAEQHEPSKQSLITPTDGLASILKAKKMGMERTSVDTAVPAGRVKTLVSTGVQADNIEIDLTAPSSEEDADDDEKSEHDSDLGSGDESIKPAWDSPMVVPREPQTPDESWGLILLKITRFLVYIVLALAVWASATLSQLSLVFLTTRYGYVKSMIAQDKNISVNSTAKMDEMASSASVDLRLLILILCIPRVLTFIISLAKLLFSKCVLPSGKMFLVSFAMGLAVATGETLLVVRVLPVFGIMMSFLLLYTTSMIPALCRLLFYSATSGSTVRRHLVRVTDLLAFLVQAGSVVYPLVITGARLYEWTGRAHNTSYTIYWELPLAAILTSFRWWENFAEKDIGFLKLKTLREEMQCSRNVMTLVNSISGLLLIPCLTLLLGALHQEDAITLFNTDNWQPHMLYPVYLQIFSTALCVYWASIASKLLMQTVSYSMPLVVSILTVISLLVVFCEEQVSPEYLLLSVDVTMHGGTFTALCDGHGTSWLAMLASSAWIAAFLWVGRHIWFPQHRRLAKREALFVNPMYLGSLIVPSLVLNRRASDQKSRSSEQEPHENTRASHESLTDPVLVELGATNPKLEPKPTRREPVDVPYIYACATMWHETEEEMKQLMKSLFRMDMDQSTRRLAQEHFGVVDSEYYEFEAHIFFDNAMELGDDGQIWYANSYVKQLASVINEAASAIMEIEIQLAPPRRTVTPYGGRLVWSMPGRNNLVVHIKDQNKIRHKKRWSQVMYMYYLLSYNIFEEKGADLLSNLVDDFGISQSTSTITSAANSRVTSRSPSITGPSTTGPSITGPSITGDHPVEEQKPLVKPQKWAKSQKEATKRSQALGTYASGVIFHKMQEKLTRKANNTFILALDGDVDFKPNAVRLLLDRMRKNMKVGGACGRIHPIGNGPIVWYQIFEYAVGHWFQKATEHVFGCVLCSPGCFSLFRGSALMDDNVMKRYATVSTQPAHFLQYDQGEDRWLCTLLLQQGHKIDYAAASDALTFAPEKFDEFFKQRRRWVTSTLANQLDVLSDFRNTTLANDNISYLFMIYQGFLTISTIFGPATIVIVIASAFYVVLDCDRWLAYLLSVIIPAVYIAVCYFCKERTQLTVAGVLAVVYACIMMVVLVGIVASLFVNSILDPSLMFLAVVSVGFLFGGMLHPYEFTCLMHGLIYFICIPVGYLVLIIYSFSNMDNVSWGTREDKKPNASEPTIVEEKPKKKFFKWSLFGIERILKELKEFLLQLFHNKDNTLAEAHLSVLQSISKRLKKMDHRLSGGNESEEKEVKIVMPEEVVHSPPQPANPRKGSLSLAAVKIHGKPAAPEAPLPALVDDPADPIWLKEEAFGNYPLVDLCPKEQDFWVKFIKKYEKPLKKDPEKEKALKEGLISLRNNVNFAIWFMNGMWIMFNYLVLVNSDIPALSLTNTVTVEPLGFIFLALYLIIFALQLLGLTIHRWGVFLQLVSITEIKSPFHGPEEDKLGRLTTEDAIRVTRELQKPKGKFGNINEPEIDYDYDEDRDANEPLHRVLQRRMLQPYEARRQQAITPTEPISRAVFHRVQRIHSRPHANHAGRLRSGERPARDNMQRRHKRPAYPDAAPPDSHLLQVPDQHRYVRHRRPLVEPDRVSYIDERRGRLRARHQQRDHEPAPPRDRRRRERHLPEDDYSASGYDGRSQHHPRHRNHPRPHPAYDPRYQPRYIGLDSEYIFKSRLNRLNSRHSSKDK